MTWYALLRKMTETARRLGLDVSQADLMLLDRIATEEEIRNRIGQLQSVIHVHQLRQREQEERDRDDLD